MDDLLLYGFDEFGYATGTVLVLPPGAGYAGRYTIIAPPDVPAGLYAVWGGGEWMLTDLSPPSAPSDVAGDPPLAPVAPPAATTGPSVY